MDIRKFKGFQQFKGYNPWIDTPSSVAFTNWMGFWTAEAQGWQDGRNSKDGGWLAEPTWHAVGRANVVQAAATNVGLYWCDVVHELERDGLGADQSRAARI